MVAARVAQGAEQERTGADLGLCRESSEAALDTITRTDILRILALLSDRAGHDFSRYKKSMLLRGIYARMARRGICTPDAYVRFLQESREEALLLFSALLIPVTRFFRDPEAFAALERSVLPELLRDSPPSCPFRAWVPGCATGEEAYSLAMLLIEATGSAREPRDFRVFATDIDERALAIALKRTFPPAIARHAGANRLRRFFKREHLAYRLHGEVRDRVTFSVHDVAQDSLFTGLDLISCRNLMIYLEPELQDLLVQGFHRALRPGGVLFLSPSESIGDAVDLFTPVSRKWKLYRANSLQPDASCRPVSTRQRGDYSRFGG
jgi:two-component system CheB/CheR fusion protein